MFLKPKETLLYQINIFKEGIFCSNFYSQVSTGTSSDSKFTLNTSLLPINSGTVFISYWNRNYLSIQKRRVLFF